eukprot:SAG25_NODE_3390_length_1100_cov_1.259740_1_plen_119_part_00
MSKCQHAEAKAKARGRRHVLLHPAMVFPNIPTHGSYAYMSNNKAPSRLLLVPRCVLIFTTCLVFFLVFFLLLLTPLLILLLLLPLLLLPAPRASPPRRAATTALNSQASAVGLTEEVA